MLRKTDGKDTGVRDYRVSELAGGNWPSGTLRYVDGSQNHSSLDTSSLLLPGRAIKRASHFRLIIPQSHMIMSQI